MKICIVSNLYPPHIIGGAEITVAKLAEALTQKGHEVLVITTSPQKEESTEVLNGVKVYRINPWNLYTLYDHQDKPAVNKALWHAMDIWNPNSHKKVKDILMRETPDVVHVNNYKGFSMSVFSSVKDCGIPLVFTAHDCSLICPRANLLHGNGEICEDPQMICNVYSNLQRRLIKGKVDWLTAPSQFIIDKLRSCQFFLDTKTSKIPLGIELAPERLAKNYDTIDISYMGGLNKIKGVQVLIKAFRKIENTKVRLHIYGKGVDEEEFKKMAEDDPRIIFHGYLERDLLLDSYQESNLTVLPSICYDNSPMMIYESLTSSTPVLASRIGGIPELIEDNHNGYLFKPGNEEELQEILEELIKNPESLKQLEKGAFESASKYSMENYLQAFEEIYQTLNKNTL
ncbi:glycosyltransferase family 4 protein [Methanobacterium sp.]|uniref:glycosyltransferase family 4 protein n=1 Tax=Methanobacterium sp. TaxID=2164 RepID=UPI002AB9E292|nr:glycosyltransferase family 4 protein [Methanobacterium sp.]MDY9923101.1 glycosyltransferase family 4 protein [Methanobacterium sp.]